MIDELLQIRNRLDATTEIVEALARGEHRCCDLHDPRGSQAQHTRMQSTNGFKLEASELLIHQPAEIDRFWVALLRADDPSCRVGLARSPKSGIQQANDDDDRKAEGERTQTESSDVRWKHGRER